MRTDNFSQSTGEKRANPLLPRLTKPFGRLAGAGMMASAMALTALPALAQQAPKVHSVSAISIAPDQVDAQTRADVSQTWQDAGDYSIKNPVIVYLVVGQTDRFSNNQLRGGFANMFTGDKNPHKVEFTNLKSFSAAENLDGAKVEFYIDGVSFGPYNFLEAVEQVPELSRKYLEHKPVHERRLAEERRSMPPATTVSTASLDTVYE